MLILKYLKVFHIHMSLSCSFDQFVWSCAVPPLFSFFTLAFWYIFSINYFYLFICLAVAGLCCSIWLNLGPRHWGHEVLATGSPGSPGSPFGISYLIQILLSVCESWFFHIHFLIHLFCFLKKSFWNLGLHWIYILI